MNYYIEEGYKLWSEYVSVSLKEKEALHISYEDLLTYPEENLRKIFNFLDLSIDSNKLVKFSEKFDSSRKYAFLSNPELVEFYNSIKNDDVMKQANYSNIKMT